LFRRARLVEVRGRALVGAALRAPAPGVSDALDRVMKLARAHESG
jgi:hypothetical protein